MKETRLTLAPWTNRSNELTQKAKRRCECPALSARNTNFLRKCAWPGLPSTLGRSPGASSQVDWPARALALLDPAPRTVCLGLKAVDSSPTEREDARLSNSKERNKRTETNKQTQKRNTHTHTDDRHSSANGGSHGAD